MTSIQALCYLLALSDALPGKKMDDPLLCSCWLPEECREALPVFLRIPRSLPSPGEVGVTGICSEEGRRFIWLDRTGVTAAFETLAAITLSRSLWNSLLNTGMRLFS